MKVSKIIFAIATVSIVAVTSCRETKTESTDDHGHEHNADGSHKAKHEDIKQEEFNVSEDTIQSKETHTHDNGEEHHDH
jgi:hypothetical protein|tara:strand:- start:932 stop:1168 length:237 start_codon:yes stop_codon:yes gene_type:complete